MDPNAKRHKPEVKLTPSGDHDDEPQKNHPTHKRKVTPFEAPSPTNPTFTAFLQTSKEGDEEKMETQTTEVQAFIFFFLANLFVICPLCYGN